MTAMKIVRFGDRSLTTPTRDVVEFNRGHHRAVQSLSYMLDQTSNGIALAANQISLEDSIFIYRDPKDFSKKVIINPEIVAGNRSYSVKEGCLSFPGVETILVRFREVAVKYLSFPSLTPVYTEVSGLTAQIFQHETEHLQGRLMIDNLSEVARNEFLERYKAISPNHRIR